MKIYVLGARNSPLLRRECELFPPGHSTRRDAGVKWPPCWTYRARHRVALHYPTISSRITLRQQCPLPETLRSLPRNRGQVTRCEAGIKQKEKHQLHLPIYTIIPILMSRKISRYVGLFAIYFR